MTDEEQLLCEAVETLHDLSRLVVVISERIKAIEERVHALERQNQTIGNRIQQGKQ